MKGKPLKKLLTLLLAAALVLTLCACGAGTAPRTDEPTPASSSAPADDTATEPADGTASESESADGVSSEPSSDPSPAPALAARAGGSALVVATGSETGTYYAYGEALARRVGAVTDTRAATVATTGSRANIEMLQMGEAQLGFTQSDILLAACAGEGLFEDDGPVTGIAAVAALYMEPVQLVTTNPDIRDASALRGRRVAVGTVGSGLNRAASDVLAACGLSESDIDPVYQSFGEALESLRGGYIDAAFALAGAPASDILSLAETDGVCLISLGDDALEALTAANPSYSRCVIPADVYGLASDVTTAAVAAVLIARDDVPDDDVYNVLYALFSDPAALETDQAAALDLAFASSLTGVPYHPGATDFYAAARSAG